MRRTQDPLPRLVESFFGEYLQRVRGASRHTVLAYSDALRIFLTFLAKTCRREVTQLRLDDVTVDRVLAFLDHLEADRRNDVATRNCRLTALRSFCRHVVRQDPARAAQYERILSLPSKKTSQRLVTYLEPEEVQVLLRQPDRRTPAGMRDFALLLFLYNTGARVSEALAVRQDDLQLRRPRQVRLHGKGSKDRICPLWKDTASALWRLVEQERLTPDAQLFRSARGEPLSRDGVAYIISKHSQPARREQATLRRKRVTPHVLRHNDGIPIMRL
jgi:site-specific recombinase XerD